VRGQLAQLGFREANTGAAALKVAMRFTTTDVPVRVIQPAIPMFESPIRLPLLARVSVRAGALPAGTTRSTIRSGVPFPAYQVSIEHQYRRELQVSIKDAATSACSTSRCIT
jgi:hypothetical protein